MNLFLGLMTLALPPATWDSFEINQSYTLTTDLALGPAIALKKGTKLNLKALHYMDEIQVRMDEFVLAPCPTRIGREKTEMILIQGEYGAQLAKGCKLEIFIEFVDLRKQSFFSKTHLR